MSPMFQSVENVNRDRLDLYDLVTHHPDATFFAKYEGVDLLDFGIKKGDVLVVDRSVDPQRGNIVVAVCDEDFIVMQLGDVRESVEVWGVIIFVIHKLT